MRLVLALSLALILSPTVASAQSARVVSAPNPANALKNALSIDGAGNVKVLSGPTLGRFQGGKFTQQPDALNVTTAPNLTVSPTGNGQATMSSLNVQGNTAAPSTREFLANFGMVSTLGAGVANVNDRGKVTLYSGMRCQTGTGDCWSINGLLRMDANSGSGYAAQAFELDLDNANEHRGDAAGVNTLTAPIAYGMAISGVGPFRSTAAISVTTGLSTPIWNHGIIFPKNAISQTTIFDNSAAPTILKAYNARTNGIDLSAASFTGAAVLSPANAPLSWIDGTAAPRQMVDGDGGGNLNLGRGAAAIFLRSLVLPGTDSGVSLGNPTNRFSSLYTPAVINSAALTLAAGGTGTVNLQTATGVQVRASNTASAPTAYVNMTGSTGVDGAAYTAISSASGSLSNIGLMLTGKGTNGVLSGVFTRTADPTASDIPAGTCADWNNTTAATFKHVCNFGGTLRSVAMN